MVDFDLFDRRALGIIGALVERLDHKECDQRDNHDNEYGDNADEQRIVVLGSSGGAGLWSGGRYGLLRRGAGWRRPLLRRASFWLGSGRGLMSGPHGHVRLLGLSRRGLLRRLNRGRGGVGRGIGRSGMFGCLCILLRLRGLAIIGYRRSAVGAEALAVFQKLAAMGAKPGHDGSFHSMCWLDYKVVQVRLGRADPTGYMRIVMPRKPCRMRHKDRARSFDDGHRCPGTRSRELYERP